LYFRTIIIAGQWLRGARDAHREIIFSGLKFGTEGGKGNFMSVSAVRSSLEPVVRPLRHWMPSILLSAVCVVFKHIGICDSFSYLGHYHILW
jgi:hypothetical protein